MYNGTYICFIGPAYMCDRIGHIYICYVRYVCLIVNMMV